MMKLSDLAMELPLVTIICSCGVFIEMDDDICLAGPWIYHKRCFDQMVGEGSTPMVEFLYVRRCAGYLPIICAEKWPEKPIEAVTGHGQVLQRVTLLEDERSLPIAELSIKYPYTGEIERESKEQAPQPVSPSTGPGESS